MEEMEVKMEKKAKFDLWCANHPKLVKAGKIAIDVIGITLVGIAGFMLGESYERSNWSEVPQVEESGSSEEVVE